MSETECPTCGDGFTSVKGLKIHHQRSHNMPLDGANHFCDTCSSSFTELNGLKRHYNKKPEHRNSGTSCPSCGNKYDSLGQHWRMNSECRKTISSDTKKILTGILMGDGSITGKDSGNPSMKIEMKNREYLQFLIESTDWIFTGKMSDNISDSYTIQTICHPDMEEYADWYSSGEKVFPDDINLTPDVLKHWYVCDGSLNRAGGNVGNPRIILYMSNEYKNTDKIDSYFKSAGLPTPSNYVTRERERHYNDETYIACSAQFTVDASKELWEYMGEAPDGFDRKWPKNLK